MDAKTFLQIVLDHRGTNPNKLRDKTGSAAIQSAASRLITGAVKNPRRETVTLLAQELGVNVEAFLSSAVALSELRRLGIAVAEVDGVSERLETKPMARLPLVGEVKGGPDGYLEELQYPVGHGEGVVEHPTSDPNAYALRVRGDSMHPRYRAGEFVIVEPNIEPQPGDDVVVVCSNGRKLLKELNWKRDGEVQLLSINNGYAPLTLPLSDVDSIQLVAGRARRSALKCK
jgi:phage repressor protein C with HTH and peptisase S24 domain